MLKINENVQSKFEEVTGLKMIDVQNTGHDIKLATFDKFSVSDEINLKLLACQGVNSEYVKLQSARHTQEGKKVYLFMVKNNQIKSFYTCYVEKTEKTLPVIKPEIVSVVPTKSDNTRTVKNTAIADTVTRKEFNELSAKLDLLLSHMVSDKTVQKKTK